MTEIIETTETKAIKFFSLKVDKETGILKGFKIDRLKFLNVLYDLGFRRLDVDNSQYFIHIYNSRIIKEVTKTQIEDSFFKHLEETYDKISDGVFVDDLINYMLAARSSFFNEEFLYRLLPKEDIVFVKDSKDEKYLFYKNKFVCITPAQIHQLPYSSLSGYIWENEILQRNYNGPVDFRPSFFEQFLDKVCKGDTNRLYSLKTIVGYNLHSYFEGKLKATVFTDSKISDDDEPNGRTGKTLFCKAIAVMLSSNPEKKTITTYCEINGKDFDSTQATKYQNASLDTKVIVVNDLKKYFDVEMLFNDITEGIIVKKLYKEPYRIKVKLILTTNKTIKIEGDSSKDRFIEFEFSDYFNKDHSPEQEFKHWFFRDWDVKEWSRFDAFMISCIKQYLEKGIVEATPINLQDRKLRDNTNTDFIEWIETSSTQHTIKQAAQTETPINKNELYEQFLTAYQDFKHNKFFTQKKFSRWIKYWGKYNKQNISITDAVTSQGRVFIVKFNN